MTARDRMILVVLLAVGAIAAAWLLAVSPRREQASRLTTQVTTLQSQLDGLQSTLAQQQAAKASFGRSYAMLTRLGEAVPADDDVPSLLYQIQHAASQAGVDFRTIQLQGGGGAAAPSGSQYSGVQLPPGVAVGAAGFPSENFSFTFRGNFFRLSNFFARLENLVVSSGSSLAVSGRLLTLQSIGLQQDAAGFPQIDATVSATAYVVPAAQGLLAGATAAGPAASETAGGSGSTAATASTVGASSSTAVVR
jgi:hypothetical protein